MRAGERRPAFVAIALALLLATSACASEPSPTGDGGGGESPTQGGSGGETLQTCRPADGTVDTDAEIESFAGCQVLQGSLEMEADHRRQRHFHDQRHRPPVGVMTALDRNALMRWARDNGMLRPGARPRSPRPSMPGNGMAAPVMAGTRRRPVMITEVPIRVSATGAQDLRLAVDVLDVDDLDLELQVLRLEGGTPSVTIELQTGMQTESSEGWVTVSAFTAVSTAPGSQKRNFTNLLRYVRWNVTALSGSGGPAATFLIHGMGRRWA